MLVNITTAGQRKRLECEIAYLKCRLTYDALEDGSRGIMAYHLGEHEQGIRDMKTVKTDDGVEPACLSMIDRFRIESFRGHARALYGG